MTRQLPVAIVGAGPIGLIAALGLARYGIEPVVLEQHRQLSLETKAGTVLTRTLEVLHRYGALTDVLSGALMVDEIGDFDRETNEPRASVLTGVLTEDTRFPFLVNIPQHELEPLLAQALERVTPGSLHLEHRVTGFTQHSDRVELAVTTQKGEIRVDASYVIACDGGRSLVRDQLGVRVEGRTLEERYMLVDVRVDLDVDNPRDYPYLAYFGDPEEWMVLVRQPHCWRFLYPLAPGRAEPSAGELAEKARRFIGQVDELEVVSSNVYAVHHRVAKRWDDGRIFLMGDAAHLITPMWALGLNTGVLDASNLPWRLAWVLRGWAAPSLLDAYALEQEPVAARGSAEMAESARAYMGRQSAGVEAMGDGAWGNALTRTLLGISLDVDHEGDWSIVKTGASPSAVQTGDRAPDLPLFGEHGRIYLHDLAADAFVALYFTDVRRRPSIPEDELPGLRRIAVSRWHAPHDSGLRGRALFDPDERVKRRFGVGADTVVLLRPDAHVAAIVPFEVGSDEDACGTLYARIIGRRDGAASRLSTGSEEDADGQR